MRFAFVEFKSQLGAAFFLPCVLDLLRSFQCYVLEVAVFSSHFHRFIKGVRSVWKTVVTSTNKSIVSACRFLSSEGIAECERACNKEKPSLQELSRAALNVSISKQVRR